MWIIQNIVSKGDYDYALVKGHPNANKNGYVLLHRVIVENNIGRLLLEDEVVHHKNHQKKDNRFENLEVLSAKDHRDLHNSTRLRTRVEYKCCNCSKIFNVRKAQGHVSKGGTYTSCSRSCNGSFGRKIQLEGKTEEVLNKIKGNFIREFKENDDPKLLSSGVRILDEGVWEGKASKVYSLNTCLCCGVDTKNKFYCSLSCSAKCNTKVDRPSKEELTKMVWEKPTTAIAADYGVSDKAVEKWCKSYEIAKPPRGYWAKQRSIIN